MGAWIETDTGILDLTEFKKSHPVWVRGLKQVCTLLQVFTLKSHPVWVRGLKPNLLLAARPIILSHPVWVRGLKHAGGHTYRSKPWSHPVWVRGLKLTQYMEGGDKFSRTLYGCVD